MSVTTYDADSMTVTVDDSEVQQALGDLAAKTPAVLKTAINKTARQMRRDEIAEAEKRYALTPKGRAKLKELKQRKKASNTSLVNVHRQSDFGHKFDAAYFMHKPETARTGWDAVMNSPRYHQVKVLKSRGYQNLGGESNRSKAFLATFTNKNANNEHLGMVRRKLDKYTGNVFTAKGHRRWRASRNGGRKGVEALETYVFPGASSMQRKVWDDKVERNTEECLQENVQTRIEQVVANAAKKKG